MSEEQNINKPQDPAFLQGAVSGSASDEQKSDIENKDDEDYWSYLKKTSGGKRPEGVVRGYIRTWF